MQTWLIMVPAVLCGASELLLSMQALGYAVQPTSAPPDTSWRTLRVPHAVAVMSASVAFAMIPWNEPLPESWRWPFWLEATALFAVASFASAQTLRVLSKAGRASQTPRLWTALRAANKRIQPTAQELRYEERR